MSDSVKVILSEVQKFVESSFNGDYEVYDVTFKQVNRRMVLDVIIDSPEGIKVSDCERVSRTLGNYLDETDLIHRAFTLEVSSPGVERLFKREVDYTRNVGRLVKWTISNQQTGKKEVFRARLQEFNPERIVVRYEKGLREFPLSAVQEARAILEFPSKNRRG